MKKWFNFRTVSNLPKPNGMQRQKSFFKPNAVKKRQIAVLLAFKLKKYFSIQAVKSLSLYLLIFVIPFGFGKLETVLN